MNVRVNKAGDVALGEIDEFAALLIRELPGIASSSDERSDARIFQSPTAGKNEEIDEEWKEDVEPELRELFADAMDLVIEDLAKLKTSDLVELELHIPAKHVDAWIHTLNRARLILGAQWEVTEDDMSYRTLSADVSVDPERPLAILKIDFYGMLLSFLVDLKSQE